MNPSILKVLLNVGKIIKAVKDVEGLVSDVVAGKSLQSDAVAICGDLVALIDSGVIVIPGISKEEAQAALQELLKAV